MADRVVNTTDTLNYFRHEFNGTGSPDKSVPPAENNLTFREQQYSDKDIPGFTAFQLKIVLTGTNSSYPPLIKDMRGIALAL